MVDRNILAANQPDIGYDPWDVCRPEMIGFCELRASCHHLSASFGVRSTEANTPPGVSPLYIPSHGVRR